MPSSGLALKSLVPLAHVRSVRRSVAFYEKLGFEQANTHTPAGRTEPVWAWLKSGEAHLMVAEAGDTADPEKHAVLFYVYCADVAAFRSRLVDTGMEAGPIEYPFFWPRGEFRVIDPDGYVLMISHT
jgi:uncharacterized glyoxalase superfamily protein PhnB